MGIKVNFSDDEAKSEAFSVDPVPTGEYRVTVKKIKLNTIKDEDAQGKPNKNAGKNFWSAQLSIQDDPYKGKVLFSNIMLFEGAGYTLAQLCKAAGFPEAVKSGNIPDAEAFLGKEVIVTVVRIRDDYAMKKNKGGDVIMKNDVKGFKSLNDGKTATAKSGKASLLPG